MMLRRSGLGLAVLVVAAATSCAPMTTAPRPTSAGAPPAAGGAPAASSTAPVATPAETLSVVTPNGTVVDTTTPSPAAERVLARIPEPLTPAQQALNPAQDTSRTRGMAVAPAAAYDSLQAAPVPAATQPLGAETSTVTMGETAPPAAAGAAPAAAASSPGAPAATGAPAAGGAASGGAAAATGAAATASSTAPAGPTATSGPCWRLQVAAPLESEKEKADARLEAAQSLLVVAFTIVPEKGYLKVRTRDCMTRETADALRKRALDSGFDGAFLVDTNAPPPTHKKQSVPASKRKR
jgi:hypothetical protein